MKPFTIRLPDDLRREFSEACEHVGLEEPAAIRSLITAFIAAYKKRGSISLPIVIASEPGTLSL